MLFGLIYVSRVARQVRFEEAQAIAADSAARNALNDITGVLLYTPSHFVQILEGPESAVRDTYARITKDPRHSHLKCVFEGAVQQRQFGDWAMKVAWLPAHLGGDGLDRIDKDGALALLVSAARP